jgi:hypothetical protein
MYISSDQADEASQATHNTYTLGARRRRYGEMHVAYEWRRGFDRLAGAKDVECRE